MSVKQVSRSELTIVSSEDGVVTYITRVDGKNVLCVLDDHGHTFYRFTLTEKNMLRLIAECSHEVLRIRQVEYFHDPAPNP